MSEKVDHIDGTDAKDRSWKRFYTLKAISRKKSYSGQDQDHGLLRKLKWYDLTAYGLGTTVGAGIFVVSGKIAHEFAGPAIVLSFLIACIVSLITGFCYGEFAARLPASGSAYVYTYTTLGEMIAFFIGWNLTLEYGISAAAVASAWSTNLVAFFENVGVHVPTWLYSIQTNASFICLNPLSLVVIIICTVILLTGIRHSAMFNNVMTLLNFAIILFIIIVGATKVDPANWRDPFAPHGFQGVMQGAAVAFFSYVGFDSVTTLGGEAVNARRDMPIAIILTVVIATVMYIATGLVMTGMVKYTQIDPTNAPLANAFSQRGLKWAAIVISIGTVTTMTATTLCSLLGQPRVYFSMAQDGLFFSVFTRLNRRRNPVVGTLVTAALAAILAFFLKLDDLSDMISLGVLVAFTVVCAAVILLRTQRGTRTPRPMLASLIGLSLGSLLTWILQRSGVSWRIVTGLGVPAILIPFAAVMFFYYRQWGDLNLPVGFQCPLVPILPCLGIIANLYLVCQLQPMAFAYFAVWVAIGMSIYFVYGIRHSKLNPELIAMVEGGAGDGLGPIVSKDIDLNVDLLRDDSDKSVSSVTTEKLVMGDAISGIHTKKMEKSDSLTSATTMEDDSNSQLLLAEEDENELGTHLSEGDLHRRVTQAKPQED